MRCAMTSKTVIKAALKAGAAAMLVLLAGCATTAFAPLAISSPDAKIGTSGPVKDSELMIHRPLPKDAPFEGVEFVLVQTRAVYRNQDVQNFFIDAMRKLGFKEAITREQFAARLEAKGCGADDSKALDLMYYYQRSRCVGRFMVLDVEVLGNGTVFHHQAVLADASLASYRLRVNQYGTPAYSGMDHAFNHPLLTTLQAWIKASRAG